jgi:large subunit ribosomal protein L30
MANKKIKIKYVSSAIGREQSQKDTVRSLGFTRLNQVREIVDNPAVRGMIGKICHLVKIVEA